METTKYFYDAYDESRTRLTNVVDQLKPEQVKFKIPGVENSVGFLLRHIADVELLFSKNVIKNREVVVKAQTVIDQKDSGEWVDLAELLEYLEHAAQVISTTIAQQDDESWDEIIETKEFGTKTKAEAFGRIISHTAYHAGQLALISKYGC